MPYYDTIEEDLARAKQILVDGRAEQPDPQTDVQRQMAAIAGGTIYGKDTYAAYKLLESFVAEIERLHAGNLMLFVDNGSDVICQCGSIMRCPDLGCDLHKLP